MDTACLLGITAGLGLRIIEGLEFVPGSPVSCRNYLNQLHSHSGPPLPSASICMAPALAQAGSKVSKGLGIIILTSDARLNSSERDTCPGCQDAPSHLLHTPPGE